MDLFRERFGPRPEQNADRGATQRSGHQDWLAKASDSDSRYSSGPAIVEQKRWDWKAAGKLRFQNNPEIDLIEVRSSFTGENKQVSKFHVFLLILKILIKILRKQKSS